MPGKPFSKIVFDFFIEPEGGAPLGKNIELLDGEEVVKKLKPHPLSFFDMYLVWFWMIFLSVLFLNYGDVITSYTFNPLDLVEGQISYLTSPSDNAILKGIPGVEGVKSSVNEAVSPTISFVQSYSAIALWVLSLLLSSLLVSALRIEFKWVAVMVGVGLISSASAYFLELNPSTTYYFSILYSLFGVVLVELYRRSHIFYVTNYRIVTEVDFMRKKRNELSYDKINNVIMEQGIIGSLLNFGTVIPVTASGLGMGSDFSSVSVGGAGQVKGGLFLGAQVTGGKTVQTPRSRSMYCLFGVRDPDSVEKTITKYLHEYVNAPYLRQMTEQLGELNKKLGGTKNV